MTALRIEKDGNAITSVDDWFRFAPPKEGLRQWVDGRSAKELAKSFVLGGAPNVPPEVRDVLASHPALGPVGLTLALPEHKIALDRFRGETRNADLAAIGTASIGLVAVTIEAKADESFGGTVGESLASVSSSPRSNLPKRIEALSNALYGHGRPEINILRYQLLHATAASLIFAREHSAVAAVFVVLEFQGPSCRAENLARNARDLDAFLKALSPGASAPSPGRLLGPFAVPGGEFVPSGLPLYIGKAVRQVGAAGR